MSSFDISPQPLDDVIYVDLGPLYLEYLYEHPFLLLIPSRFCLITGKQYSPVYSTCVHTAAPNSAPEVE